MGTKAIMKSDESSNQSANLTVRVKETWAEFQRFLSDVRGEMRKVVTPSRREVQTTTTVVLITVFVFGLFFFVVDNIFGHGMDLLLRKLGGL